MESSGHFQVFPSEKVQYAIIHRHVLHKSMNTNVFIVVYTCFCILLHNVYLSIHKTISASRFRISICRVHPRPTIDIHKTKSQTAESIHEFTIYKSKSANTISCFPYYVRNPTVKQGLLPTNASIPIRLGIERTDFSHQLYICQFLHDYQSVKHYFTCVPPYLKIGSRLLESSVISICIYQS